MIYQKEEFVEDETGDSDFPIKMVDRLQSRDGDTTRFIGRATLNMRTPMGIQQFPISFEIEADSVEDAFEQYSDAARPRIEEVRERVQEQLQQLRQQQEGQIVTPDKAQTGQADIINFDDLRSE
ncbi:MAG: hypothetical protein R6X33_12515 [Candidatus Brocadiia bacterium]